MEDLSISSAEFKYKTAQMNRLPPLSKFGSELKDRIISAPAVEKYITTYPIADWKNWLSATS